MSQQEEEAAERAAEEEANELDRLKEQERLQSGLINYEGNLEKKSPKGPWQVRQVNCPSLPRPFLSVPSFSCPFRFLSPLSPALTSPLLSCPCPYLVFLVLRCPSLSIPILP